MSEPVIDIREVAEAVVQIRMQDKNSKNTFSVDLAEGLIDAFGRIKDQTQYRVVILTGYDSYFCSGGTQDALLSINEGKLKFTDRDLYSLALNCPIPVIAAMQGHGIGGGFIMGMFADFVILSRESIYTTNFMKYGFTPGMGSTFILPIKFGLSLAEEMMISARTYRGEELQTRGIPFPVLSRDKVMEYALDLAITIAEKPRISLVTLKNHLVAPIRDGLANAIEQETLMHETTFHQPEVRDRIKNRFGNL